MNLEQYRRLNFLSPAPTPRFAFTGAFGVTLLYEDFEAAVDFYSEVLGDPGYQEADGTRGWSVGTGWLTLLRGENGNPSNVEVQFQVESPAEAERLQAAFLAAGGTGPAPTDELMYDRVRSSPVADPFGVDLLIFSLYSPQ